MIYTSDNLEETHAIAKKLSDQIVPGTCITLEGPLGAGKTTFVRSLVEVLGGDPRQVSSPTFMLMNIYRSARCPIFHLDAYRVSGADDLEAIGFSELLDEQGVVIVEWASRVQASLPEKRLSIRIEVISETGRRFEVMPIGG